MAHPCLGCGACCASFRVDFAVQEWGGNENASGAGPVPAGLAERLTAHLCRMRGTDHRTPRCAALGGTVGLQVACSIYEWRPAPCREFAAGSDACDQARRRHGLAPLWAQDEAP